MAFENVGVEVFLLAAANGLDEVAEVVAAALEDFEDPLAVRRERHPAVVIGADYDPLLAVEDVADRGEAQRIGGQAAHLEQQQAVAVVEQANLRVRRLAVIDVAEPPA